MGTFSENLIFIAVLVNFIRNTVSEDEFIRLGIWCFSFHLEYEPRHTFEKICSEKGGQLIMLDSDKKIAVVRKYIKARGFTSELNLQKRQILLNSYHRIQDTVNYGERFCRMYKNYGMAKPSKITYIPNKKLRVNFLENQRANLTTPTGFVVEPFSITGAGLGAWAKKRVRMFTVIGEYEGEEHRNEEFISHYQWTVDLLLLLLTTLPPKRKFNQIPEIEQAMSYYIDAASPAKSNWLRCVNCARNVHEENLKPIICDGLVFYMTSKDVEPDTELLVWNGTEYGKHLGIARIHPSDELDLKSTFYIRIYYSPQAPDSTLDSFNSHISNRPNSSETNNGILNKTYFGMLDSYRGGMWKLVLEKNYSYFSDDGLHFPFICEYNQNICLISHN